MTKEQREDVATMMSDTWTIAELEPDRVTRALLEAAGNLLEAALENVTPNRLTSRVAQALNEAMETAGT